MRKFPIYMRQKYGSHRNFKQLKRQHAREAMKAVDVVCNGCAFFEPLAYKDAVALRKLMTSLRIRLSVREWGR